jgi:hypothetical protein
VALSVRCLVYALLVGLLTACSNPIMAALATATPTSSPTATPTTTSSATHTTTPTPSPTNTPLPTLTPTSAPLPTVTPIPTATSSPTATLTPPPVETPTFTPVPPTPTPTETPRSAVDFRIASWRLWPLALNSGCAKGMHSIFITVLDAAGNPLNDIVVGDTWNNVEVVTGDKGVGKAEINLWTNTMEVFVKRDVQGQLYTSEVSFPFSSFMTTIPDEQMIQAGYCANELECQWKRQNESYYCGGHYSWEVIFQKTH